jgi:hypothetical protein
MQFARTRYLVAYSLIPDATSKDWFRRRDILPPRTARAASAFGRAGGAGYLAISGSRLHFEAGMVELRECCSGAGSGPHPPYQQTGHVTAPDQCCKTSESSCQGAATRDPMASTRALDCPHAFR